MCDDASAEKPNCSCSCTNGIMFDQPLDPFHSPSSSSSSSTADETICQAEKTECLAREQTSVAEVAALKDQLAASNKELADNKNQLTACNKQLTDNNNLLATSNKQLAASNKQLTDNKNLLAASNKQLAAYKNAPAYVYLGCFVDTTPRVLNSKQKQDGAMTVQMCEAFCKGYKYYGLQMASYCFCGNTFAVNSKSRPESDCNNKCAGNKSQICGAVASNSLYARKS